MREPHIVRPMDVSVVGLGHLGTVTCACLAWAGNRVVGVDWDREAVVQLQAGEVAFHEPGVDEMLRGALASGHLRFETDIAAAIATADIVWVAYDTPLDDQDRADVEFVVERVARLFPYLQVGALIMISSQVVVGTTARLEQAYAASQPGKPVTFAYSPENLQLGEAVRSFTRPERVIVGVREGADRTRVASLLTPFSRRIQWMSVESAEMTKHAMNAFLATSIAFINEIAILCEHMGADAKEVERGLRSEPRIGARAYVSPGAAFSGGTLARDLAFLSQLGLAVSEPTHLLSAVRTSNDEHGRWVRRKLQAMLGDLRGLHVALWGLAYKAGTDSLRRSAALELCVWLVEQGALVQAHDLLVKSLPPGVGPGVRLHSSPLDALRGAAALVVLTQSPEYLSVASEAVVSGMRTPIIVDPNRFVERTLGEDSRIRYVGVGRARV